MPRIPAAPRQYAKTPGQRTRILDAAMEVFAQRGGRGSSLREIAERVGMSQAGLLHHFGSKSALLLAVLERLDQEDQPERPLESLEDGIGFVRGELERGLERPGLFQLQVTLTAESIDPDHPAHTFFVERYQRVARQFTGPLQEAADRGALRAGVDPAAVAHLLMAALDGLQLHHSVNEDVDIMAAFDLLLETLTATVVAEP